MNSNSNFSYKSTDITQQGGKKIVRKVTIKRGKGIKSVTVYNKGKKTRHARKHIHDDHITLIRNKKFIPGLFGDCVKHNKNGDKK